MSDMIGQVIGQYQIEKLLGQGGMGAVYRARDVQLQRPVAFKIMHPEIAAHEDLRKRFLQEARAIAALDHPNIIRIYAFHGETDLLYLVMEYVTGGSLREYLKRLQAEQKFIDIGEAIVLVKQLAAALHYAHERGMVHRDVKPDNVLLKLGTLTGSATQVSALLTDFGLAKLAENAVVQTAGHNPMGTLPYMPPEQIRGEAMDGRTDLYALGILMYELIVGRLPFMPRNIPEAARMHGSEDPPKPSSLRPGISADLEAIILRAIEKHPDDRFQNGNDIIAAIEKMEAKAASADYGDNLATYIDPKVLDSKKEVSLGTYLASMPTPSDPSPDMPAAPANLQNDQIAIVRKGYSTQYVPITKQALTIGRDPAHEISIEGDKVSRNHARIERNANGSYSITDLGSTNGTFLDEAKLLSNVAEPWRDDQVVSIGDFRLSIQRASVNLTQQAVRNVQPSIADVRPAAGIAPREAAPPPLPTPQMGIAGTADSKVSIQMIPPNFQIEPGMQTTVQVEIFNQSEIVDHYRIQLQGVPQEWYTVPPQALQLMPGTKGMLTVLFHPPRDIKATAGMHQFNVRVNSQEKNMEVGRGMGGVTVKPFHQYQSDLDPKRVRKKGMTRFIIINQGNAPDSYTIFGRDREDSLQFFPPSASGSVNPGMSEALEFEIRPKRGNFIGTTKTYPFEFQVDAASGRAQVQNGELVQAPTIPIWLLSLLMLLCLACLLLLLLLFLNRPEEQAEDLNHVTATNQEVRDLLTATAVQYVTREANISITATAIANSDDDDDGLTYAEELELGTDPNIADTDNDGLLDGDEVNEHDTLPLNPDSDNDGLLDGEEIDEGTDPNRQDSDRDGLFDGEEVQRHNTDPLLDDTDRDGLPDGDEIELGTDPNERDTDGDGRRDSVDTNPLVAD